MQAQIATGSTSQPVFLSDLFPFRNITPQTRTCVYRRVGDAWLNVNDECGLPAFGDYTISEYLDDLWVYEGKRLLTVVNVTYVFSDGSVAQLYEQEELLGSEGRAEALLAMVAAGAWVLWQFEAAAVSETLSASGDRDRLSTWHGW
jgi:hypothetical protein